MNVTELLNRSPLAVLFLAILVTVCLSVELGYRAGRRRLRRRTGEEEIQAGPLVTASLSLLAFMLTMVFGTVTSRFHELNQVALDEANTIGTTYLRADLLPEPDRGEVRELLREHVDLRVEVLDRVREIYNLE